jgi:hypothetical protein
LAALTAIRSSAPFMLWVLVLFLALAALLANLARLNREKA